MTPCTEKVKNQNQTKLKLAPDLLKVLMCTKPRSAWPRIESWGLYMVWDEYIFGTDQETDQKRKETIKTNQDP